VLAGLLVALGTVPGWGVHLALPLSALLAAGAIWNRRPRQLAWRWAAWGTLFWAAEETVWAAARLIFKKEFVYVTDPLYFAGTACWFVALSRMPQRAAPRISFVVALPALLFTASLLLQDADFTAMVRFPVVDLALLLFALPAIEGAFRGELPEGRLLWWLGLFVRVLAGSLFVWLNDYPFTAPLFFFLWVFAYTFIGLGAWLELLGTSAGLWPVAYGLLGLEVVAGTVLALSLPARVDAPHTRLALALLLGYLLFTGMMLLVVADRNRRTRAEHELKRWSVLLEQLVQFSPFRKAAHPHDSLQTLLNTLGPFFPDLCGVLANADRPLLVGEGSAHAFPLVTEGTEVGRLYFRSAPTSVGLLDALTPLLATQVEGALAHAHLHTQTLTDPLTNLRNRRSFEVQGAGLAALAYRHHQPVGLAVLDIDHFKRVNDRYGHPVGDEALRTVADILRRNTREEDLVLRWGGEEFVLLLYGTTLEGTAEVVGRIRSELLDRAVAPIAWPLTISVGLAGGSVPSGEETLHGWLGAADRALLRAKQAGRDRVEVATL
jgi:diguanylate cyclase (GGDEF)-like protein